MNEANASVDKVEKPDLETDVLHRLAGARGTTERQEMLKTLWRLRRSAANLEQQDQQMSC